MSRDELAVMDGGKCVLLLRGVGPFLSDKYDITAHKRYKELSDYSEDNAFDVEEYLHRNLKMGRDEPFELIEFSEEDLADMEGIEESQDVEGTLK